jgi:hypothetical protein
LLRQSGSPRSSPFVQYRDKTLLRKEQIILL